MEFKVKVNGKVIDLVSAIARLGISPDSVESIELSRNIDAGELVVIMRHDDLFPGVDTELRLPESAKSCPILLSRTEQDRDSDADEHPVRTFMYARNDTYVAYYDHDVRPDDEVDEDVKAPNLHVAGDPDAVVDVTMDNTFYHIEN